MVVVEDDDVNDVEEVEKEKQRCILNIHSNHTHTVKNI